MVTPSVNDSVSQMPARVKPVVVAPTFNNDATLGDVIARVQAQGMPVIVVNDGSADQTPQLLASLAEDETVSSLLTVVEHASNRGKAVAIRSGAAAARQLGYSHIITIDTDGQHDPEDIPAMVDAAKASPFSLVLGTRPFDLPDCPPRSTLGRRLSNLGVRLHCGAALQDTQCGFRVYPLVLLENVNCRAGWFAFETEVLTRAVWAGFEIVQVDVTSRYLPAESRVSHFKPWRDSLRCIRLHARLLTRAMMPWPHRRTSPAPPAKSESWWDIIRSLSPREMWRQLRADDLGRLSLAAGLSVGAFIANLPTFGLQTLLAIYAARRLHLHPLAVILGSFISTPPIGPVLIAMAIFVGHLVLHGSLPTFSYEFVANAGVGEIFQQVIFEWFVGSLIVGTACMVLMFLSAIALTSRIGGRAQRSLPEPESVEAAPEAAPVVESSSA